MDLARDKSGKLIHARDALYGGTYRCPYCRAEVFPRKGDHNIPHFAHRSGRALPGCELYHPSDDVRGPQPSIPLAGMRDGENYVRPHLQISIELEPENEVRRNRGRQWGLRLTIPKSEDGHGQISVDTGAVHRIKLPLRTLLLESRTLRVEADAPDFGIGWFSPEVDPRYREALSARMPGLDPLLYNVFAANSQRLKPRASRLSWGGTNYFVWKKEIEVPFPPSLFHRPLAQQGAWRCAFVSLPDEKSEDLHAWLIKNCGLPVDREPRQLGLIFPVAYDVDVVGRTCVFPSSEFLFRARGVEREPANLEFRLGCSRAPVELPANQSNFLISLKTDAPAGDEPIFVSWGAQSLSPIRRMAAAPPTAMPSVLATFDPMGGGRNLVTARLHEQTARNQLQAVRTGPSLLAKITAPLGVAGYLRWREKGSVHWQTLTLLDAEPDQSYRREQISVSTSIVVRVNEILKNRRFDTCLDFGSFGYCFSPGTSAAVRGIERQLAASTRAKIIWFCKTARHYALMPGRLERLDDTQLVKHFQKCPPTASLIAHRRSISLALAREMPDGGSA
jgi:hypothetical protein